MDTRQSLGVFALVAAGSTMGFLAGLLSAPASGRETRRRLGRRLDDEAEHIARRGRHAARRLGDRIEGGIDEAQRAVAGVVER